MLVLIPIAVAFIGLLMWIFCTQQILKEAGRILFACGAFVAVLRSGGEMFKLIGG